MPKQVTLVCSHILKFDGPGYSNAENQASNAKRLIDSGVDMIEMDIQITKDGIPVLFHDNDLDNKTTGTGKISSKTWAEVSTIKYKAGSAPISRLDEVTNYLKSKASNTILQLDKCDETELNTINNLGLFKGIEKKILAKRASFTAPSIIAKAGILFMPIIPSTYVGKMNTDAVIDEIVSKARGSNFLEAQFSDSDTLLINGTLARKLSKIGCQLLVVAVGGTKDTNGASFRGDSKNQWSKMVNPMGAGVIMTNSPIKLKTFLQSSSPIDLDAPFAPLNTIPQQTPIQDNLAIVNNIQPGSLTPVSPGAGFTASVLPTQVQTEQSTFLSPSVSPQPVIVQESSRGNTFAESLRNQTNFDVSQIQKLTSFFEPTIRPTQIKVDLTPIKDKLSTQDVEHITSDFSYKPLVYYYGYAIAYTDIRKLVLYHIGILPAVEMVFFDSWGIFKEDGFPIDNAIITLFINSRSDNLRSILMDFKILEFKDNGQGTYTIVGSCNIPELYLKKFKSYSNKTSHETMQLVAKECELGFCSNIKNSNDLMTYINPGYMVKDFITSTIENSYISDRSFQSIYIDFYYNLCYVDIYSELERDISNDLALDTEIITEKKVDDTKTVTDESRLGPLLLTTEKSFKDTNVFIQNFEIDNKSTIVSLNKAYRTKTKFYDVVNKMMLIFNVESQTSDGTKTMILKSTPQDNKFFQENTQSIYLGKQDVIKDGVGNVHQNFQYATIQNRQNLDDITKISAKFYLPNENFNLHIFQKVKVIFIPQNPAATEELFFKRITGDWLITKIEFHHQDNSHYQLVTAIKRELGLLPDEMDKFPKKTTVAQQNYQTYTNQLAPGDAPFANNVGPAPSNPGTTTTVEGTPPAVAPGQDIQIEASVKQTDRQTALDEFFNLILSHESKTYDDHNWYLKGDKLKGYIKGRNSTRYSLLTKDLSQCTLGEVKSFQNHERDKDVGQLWATGRYQIIPKTLKSLISTLKLSENQLYSKDIQDKMGYQLLLDRIPIKQYLEGKVTDTIDNIQKAALSIAQIWSSCGVPYAMKGSRQWIQKDESYYSGGGDRAATKVDEIQKALVILRRRLLNENLQTPVLANNANQNPQTVQNQSTPSPPGSIVNIVIGDSQTPAIAAKSKNFQLLSNDQNESSLWTSGKNLTWLLDALKKFPTTTTIKNVAINIGTNGGFSKNDNIKGLVVECRRAFPSAKLFAVKGSWNWGGNIPKNGVDEEAVNTYYNRFAAEGVEVIGTPIGDMNTQLPKGGHPDQNKTANFVTIGQELDSKTAIV
jgi:hypothetical protein